MEQMSVKGTPQTLEQIVQQVSGLLEEGQMMWNVFACPHPEISRDLQVVEYAAKICRQEAFRTEFAAACQCFYLFRRLHAMAEACPETATLLGDYYFSQFSVHLIPIDSPRLIDCFSEYLKWDTKQETAGEKEFDLAHYLSFITRATKEIGA